LGREGAEERAGADPRDRGIVAVAVGCLVFDSS
jgi:hypothetical protein